MRRAIDETNRRREKQLAYNRRHKITPRSIVKSLEDVRITTSVADARRSAGRRGEAGDRVMLPDGSDDPNLLRSLEEEMWREAEALHFERAASIRDRIEEIRMSMQRRGRGGRSKRRAGRSR
jgi:excinuclease ABC subunit B